MWSTIALLLLATFAVPVAAQTTDEPQIFSLPESWNGDDTVTSAQIAEAAPPFQVIDASGEFRFTFVPNDEGNSIRILPDGATPGAHLTLAWPLDRTSSIVPFSAGSVFVLDASARAFSRPEGVMLTIREFDGTEWTSSSVPMQDIQWTDYSVARQIGEDTVEVQVGLQWRLPDDKAWIEFRDMKLTVLPVAASEEVDLSPEDTPTPVATPTPTALPAPAEQTAVPSTSDGLIVVTSTPTPADVFAAATQVAVATENAEKIGTATPTPENMVTATPTATELMITNTPVPANSATAEYQAALATAIAATTGTPTPVPSDARIVVVLPTPTNTPPPPPPPPAPTVTPTPTPVGVPYDQIMFPTSTPTVEFPTELVGKILFLSPHLASNPRQPNAYMINPDGTGLTLLKSRELYNRAKARDAYSADKRFHAYSLREPLGARDALIQVYYDDKEYGSTHHQLTYFGAGTAWAPSWSPRQDAVVLVSSESSNDEIWLVRRNDWPPMQLTKNDWEWDRSPSFSPDGTQIVFESNRETGTRQLWLMDASGQNQRQITNFDFETWDPVWVKYADD
ncbi:MAG: TolB family protein [Caldilineaceae bacterium]